MSVSQQVRQPKLLVLGLDCADPVLLFERWREQLPFLNRLMTDGLFCPMQSTIPPITIPAWMSMMTSKDPGRLGVYGFRNRRSRDYAAMNFATSRSIVEPTVWDILARAGKQVIVVGVPQTYPPKPVNGSLISCFLTPDAKSSYTYPAQLKSEIEQLVGEYIFDVHDFRTDRKEKLIAQIYRMAEQHFTVLHYLVQHHAWDFLMYVDMGVDRIHHGFWRFMDPQHRLYEPGNPYEHVILDYYKYLDAQLQSLVAKLPDEVMLMVVSDHGAKAMIGGVCINEWLLSKGYLHLLTEPSAPTQLSMNLVDWSKTLVWGEGGYYGRIFINVQGREPMGVLPQAEYESFRSKLAAEIAAIPDPQGNQLGTKVFRPEEVYSEVRGIPPDLLVYFGDLRWRSVGSVGLKTLHTFTNDTGPDDANHAEYGIFMLSAPDIIRDLPQISIYDVAPTILELLGVKIPPDMIGRSLVNRQRIRC